MLATAILVPTALVGVGSATADSGTGTATVMEQQGPPGQAGHRGPDIAKLAAMLGVTETDLKAALDTTRPSGTAMRGDRGAELAKDIAAALGVTTAQVRSILEANTPTERPAPGTKPDQSALLSALSSGLGVDKATVKEVLDKLGAGHKAQHEARETAMALAKQLNLDGATVKQALAELRPAGGK